MVERTQLLIIETLNLMNTGIVTLLQENSQSNMMKVIICITINEDAVHNQLLKTADISKEK